MGGNAQVDGPAESWDSGDIGEPDSVDGEDLHVHTLAEGMSEAEDSTLTAAAPASPSRKFAGALDSPSSSQPHQLSDPAILCPPRYFFKTLSPLERSTPVACVHKNFFVG